MSFELIRHIQRLEGRIVDLIGHISEECADAVTPQGNTIAQSVDNDVTLTVDIDQSIGARCFSVESSGAGTLDIVITFYGGTTLSLTSLGTETFTHCVPLNYPNITRVQVTNSSGGALTIAVNYWN